MQIRAEHLQAHLAKTLAPLYVIHGDEPLPALEAADQVRAAARAHGIAERAVLLAERNYDWSEFVHAGASHSLFGGAKLLELRLPSGRPGVQGAAALERHCARLAPPDITLITLPRLDRAALHSSWFAALGAKGVVIDVWPMDRAHLPAWIGARLAANGQRAGREVLDFLAERVEGNLLAAHQEVQKLALLAPAGELALEVVEQAVANVARYSTAEALLALLGGERARYLRVLEGLKSEGESVVPVLYAIASALLVLRGAADGRAIEPLCTHYRVFHKAAQRALAAAARRLGIEALDGALARAARADRIAKGVAKGDAWEELVALGLELAHGAQGARQLD